MISMRKTLLAAAIAFAATSAHADVLYSIGVTTSYMFGNPGNVINGVSGGPDTGFVTITNNGPSTFTGTIGDVAQAGNSVDYSYMSGLLTLTSGQSATFGINGESSNVGGYNGGSGIQVLISGNVTDGVNTTGLGLLSVYDKDIHSGVVRSTDCCGSYIGAPNGVLSDSYVLQGGDPRGIDTGDAFETTQAPGHYVFTNAVPEPETYGLFGLGAIGLLALRRRKA